MEHGQSYLGSDEKVRNESDSSRKLSGRFAFNAEDGSFMANKINQNF